MEAFLRLVLAHGYDSVTIQQIADEADYGRWTFYQYFKSKEEIAYAIFVQWMTEFDKLVVAAVATLAPPLREYESWRVILKAVHNQRALLQQVRAFRYSAAWLLDVREFLVQQFLGHLQSGTFSVTPGVRPELAARLFVSAMLELIDFGMEHAEPDEWEALVDELFLFLYRQAPPSPP